MNRTSEENDKEKLKEQNMTKVRLDEYMWMGEEERWTSCGVMEIQTPSCEISRNHNWHMADE